MLRYSRLVGFDNNSFHPDDGDSTAFNGTTRPTAFPTAEPLRTIRIASNEKLTSVRLITWKTNTFVIRWKYFRNLVQMALVQPLQRLCNQMLSRVPQGPYKQFPVSQQPLVWMMMKMVTRSD